MDFEKKLNELEKIVEHMESGEQSLDDSLKSFELGVQLSRQCHEELSKAELKVKKLLSVSEANEPIDEDFETDK